MNSYNKKGRSGGNRDNFRDDRGGSDSSRRFGGGDRDESRMMYKAVCDDCGKTCQVPFKPSGSKPVYCSACFEKHGNGEDNFKKYSDSGDKQMFSAVCDECGKRCEVPFKPSNNKPIYCSDCFRNKGEDRSNFNNPPYNNSNSSSSNSSRDLDELKGQLRDMNQKLDKLIDALTTQD